MRPGQQGLPFILLQLEAGLSVKLELGIQPIRKTTVLRYWSE